MKKEPKELEISRFKQTGKSHSHLSDYGAFECSVWLQRLCIGANVTSPGKRFGFASLGNDGKSRGFLGMLTDQEKSICKSKSEALNSKRKAEASTDSDKDASRVKLKSSK
jgi:hypothetical protein